MSIDNFLAYNSVSPLFGLFEKAVGGQEVRTGTRSNYSAWC
jgi:hypothetical protein